MELLNLAGKSHDDLLADVELVLKRREWAKQVKALEVAKAKAAAARRKIDELEEKKAAAIKPFDEQIESLLADTEGSIPFMAIMQSAFTAEQQLRETISPELEELIVATSAESGDISKRLKYCQERIRENQTWLEEVQREIEQRDARDLTGVNEGERRTRQDLLAQEQRHKQTIREMEAEADQLAARKAELERKVESLNARRLQVL